MKLFESPARYHAIVAVAFAVGAALDAMPPLPTSHQYMAIMWPVAAGLAPLLFGRAPTEMVRKRFTMLMTGGFIACTLLLGYGPDFRLVALAAFALVVVSNAYVEIRDEVSS